MGLVSRQDIPSYLRGREATEIVIAWKVESAFEVKGIVESYAEEISARRVLILEGLKDFGYIIKPRGLVKGLYYFELIVKQSLILASEWDRRNYFRPHSNSFSSAGYQGLLCVRSRWGWITHDH